MTRTLAEMLVDVEYWERIAAVGNQLHLFRIGVFAIIESEHLFLLARRRDIGWWNLAGGGMEAGETVDQALRREVREEVGIEITIDHLVGIYSKPQKSEVVLTFWCGYAGGTPGQSDEVSEVGWFTLDSLPEPFLPKHRQRLLDAVQHADHAVIAAQTSSSEDDQRLERPM
jgi:ADP-ribose pyrophosphatase YjhB (NUDIX family)